MRIMRNHVIASILLNLQVALIMFSYELYELLKY